tara:strand:+ start:128 stop:379 length:252 start_codon:yes stop_codon:yes gene_type:complete
MTTLDEMIKIIKGENPNGLRVGDDEAGYIDLSPADYQTTIEKWAEGRLAKEAHAKTKAQAVIDKASLLAKLGITADEAKLLLS